MTVAMERAHSILWKWLSTLKTQVRMIALGSNSSAMSFMTAASAPWFTPAPLLPSHEEQNAHNSTHYENQWQNGFYRDATAASRVMIGQRW